jgi:glycosyltransferase involved in cell wall biosynthesis
LQNIKSHFQSGQWLPATNIERSFVRYANSEVSPGTVWLHPPDKTPLKLSVIIPTIDANRDGYFLKLLDQINHQDLKDFEIIVVCGDPLQGRAINIAASLARGKYLMTLDDDTSLSDHKTFKKLVDVMEKHPEIGIAGGNNTIPHDATPFIRQVMKQIPRRSWQAVSEITISDLAEHPCMIMRTEEFKKVGGENEIIPRGLDPYLREQFRKIKKWVVVVPGVFYHHLSPDNLRKLLRQFFRNGYQASFISRYYPQWMIETPSHHGAFKERKSSLLRMLRFPITLSQSLITFKPIWFLCEMAYAFGFIWGILFLREPLKR